MALDASRHRAENPFDALPQHLRRLMDRHPLLRTRMALGPQGPAQWIASHAEPVLRTVEVGDMPLAQLRDRIRQDTRQPFDLTSPPLWRVHLYRRSAGRWAMAVAAHHLLLDFWSLGLLLREAAADCGLTPPAPPLDGEGFFRLAGTAPAMTASLPHWRHTLDGAPVTHGLPLDFARPDRPSHEGASLPFRLQPGTSAGVRELARAHQATPFMVMLAAYVVWLHRLSGDADMVVATPMAGRPRREHRLMLGQFVQTLPVRARVTPRQSFTEVLQSVRHQVIEGMRHPAVSFAQLVSEIAPQRDTRLDPLTQLGFSWEHLPVLDAFAEFFLPRHDLDPDHTEAVAAIETSGGSLALHPLAVPQQEGQLDLLMEMGGEHQGAWLGVLKYRTALFDPHTMAQWLDAWTHLVDQLVRNPWRPVGDHALSATAVMRGKGMVPRPPNVLAWLRERVDEAPDAPAIEDTHHTWCRRDLLARAHHVRQRLQAAGVQPGDHVGLMLDRHADLPAAIWGIWLSQATYVPLDPTFPADRLHHMIADAGLRACVSESAYDALWDASSPPRVCLAPADEVPAALPGNLGAWPELPPTHIAYILYTSGSTGQPKGVRVSHGALLNFFAGMCERLPASLQGGPAGRTGGRWLAVTTPAFDISVLELLWPVLAGGTVVVCDTPTTRDGQALAQRLKGSRIDVMQATPASWRLLLGAGWQAPGTERSLTALCGGEPLPATLAEELLPHCASLWNLYGPTETTVWSSLAQVHASQPIHLGTPLANTQLHVLDDRQRPVPLGVMGELWIGGAGLAVDYWHQPELTAERFRALPHLPAAGRLYRTGDRVRLNARGHLEHHGRLDTQVKLRGFRIELGEIENCLRRHPAVADAAVALRQPPASATADPRLVAYVVRQPDARDSASPRAGDETLRDELRRHVQAHLPRHMVPSDLVHLAELPQTPNRKTDRQALPDPDWRNRPAHADAMPPRDALEMQLMSVFERHLGTRGLGVNDDFFQHGGHSLLAMQVLQDLQRLLQVTLPVAEFMRHPSVGALATRLRDQAPLQASPLVAMNRAAQEPARANPVAHPLWLFHPIGGSVFCYRALASHLPAEQPVFALQSPGLEQEGLAEVSVEAIAAGLLDVVRAHQARGPYHLGGWCFGGVLAFEVSRQLHQAGETLGSLTMIDTRAPVMANLPGDGDDATLMSWFARDLAVPYGKVLDMPPGMLRGLPADDMFDAVLRAARDLGVLAESAQPALLRRYFEVYLANGIALQTYLPQPCPLPGLLVLAQDEPADHGPLLGWEQLLGEHLRTVRVSGDHNSVVQEPHVGQVAAHVAAQWLGPALSTPMRQHHD